MPKISIITPLFNGSKTLEETAASVFAQDYIDWEWIFFDDGSNDGTKEIARKYEKEFPGKIFLYEHEQNENHGTAFTRNRAVEKSIGEVISFIDQDDIWYKDRLSSQLTTLEKTSNCAMIWGPSLYWYKDREFKQPIGYRGKGLPTGLYHPPDFIEIFLSDLRGTPIPGAILVRRKFFDEVKGYDESIKGSEDIVLWLKIAERFPIFYEDKILVKYRKHAGSTLRIANESGDMDKWDLDFYKWVIDFLKKTSAKKSILKENEFAYYKCLKRIAGKKNYFASRKELLSKLNSIPELKKKYIKDYLLDVILPFDLATRVSAKLRFDWFKGN
ncbi:MAG: glycosyltransferase [Ignavibacteria bacterium]